MPAGNVRSALARISLTRALVGLGALLVVINVCSAIWNIRADRQRTEQAAQRAVSNITSLLAEQSAASLEAADLILRDAQRGGSASRVAASIPRLRDELAHIPQIADIMVLDRRGEILAQTSELPAIDPDFATLPLFTAHRDARAEGLILSEPFLGGPVATSWRFVLSRRLNAPGGAFDGVLAAVMEIDRFERLYQTIDVGEGGFITLLSLDGVVITRVPDYSRAKGRKFHSHEILAAVLSAGRFDGWTSSPVIGERVLLSASAVRGFPVFVASGGTERAVLASWR